MSRDLDHVLAAIDGALADDEWPDAMRWAPEPAQVTDAGRYVYAEAEGPPHLDAYGLREFVLPGAAEARAEYERRLARAAADRQRAHAARVRGRRHPQPRGMSPAQLTLDERWPGVEHAPGCDTVHEYLGRPPSCRCGALDRAALSMPRQQGRAPLGAYGVAIAAAADHEAAVEALRRAFTISPEQLDRMNGLMRDFGLAARQAAEQIGKSLAALGEALTPHLDELRRTGLLPDPGPADPRERALWLRQHRNTGPKVPRAQAAHRPRRHR